MGEVVDAVVIGAGHNGLVAANALADAGWDVLVLEAQPHAGGAVRSAEVCAPGFVTDLFSSFYPLTAASPIIAGLSLEDHGLRWRHSPVVLAHPLPDGRCAVLSRDIDETAASLDEFAPGDGDEWRRMAEQWQALRTSVLQSLFTPLPPVRGGASMLRALGPVEALRFARFALTPVRRFAQENFTGEGAGLLLAGNALHSDLFPEGPASAVFGWLLCMLGQDVGFPVPEGGSGKLIDALVDRLQVRAGAVRLSSPVEKVLIRGGRAVGVRIAGGEEVMARHAVLADVTAPQLYRDLVGLEHIPARMRDDLDRFDWDEPTVKVNWALSAPVSWTASAAKRAGTVHVGVDMDGLTDYAADLRTGRVPQQPFVLFGQTTTADATRSPAGTESAWAYTHLPRRHPLDRETVDRHVELIEERIETYAPGFRDLVIGRFVQRPQDMEDADSNLHTGAINGGTSALHQQLVFRPTPGLGRPETPIEGLYLSGSSAHPGGGVHGAPGWNAARAALARRRVIGRIGTSAALALTRRIARG